MRQTTPRERTTSVAGSASLDNGATRSLLTVHQRGSDLTEEDKDTVMEFLNVPINNN